MNGIPFLMKIKQILFKDKKLKRQIERNLKVKIKDDAELTDKPDLKREIFDTEKYKKKKLNETKKINNNIFDKEQ
jgi:hypothetical protein